jgi:hypothetical protein
MNSSRTQPSTVAVLAAAVVVQDKAGQDKTRLGPFFIIIVVFFFFLLVASPTEASMHEGARTRAALKAREASSKQSLCG